MFLETLEEAEKFSMVKKVCGIIMLGKRSMTFETVRSDKKKSNPLDSMSLETS